MREELLRVNFDDIFSNPITCVCWGAVHHYLKNKIEQKEGKSIIIKEIQTFQEDDVRQYIFIVKYSLQP